MSEVQTISVSDDLSVPNCATCLEPVTPVLGAWWCESCRHAYVPGGEALSTAS
jgi:hypothetical protein